MISHSNEDVGHHQQIFVTKGCLIDDIRAAVDQRCRVFDHRIEVPGIKLDLRAAGGSHLDLFSGYGVGGIIGLHPVGGYFRQEFRAQRVALLNVRHDLNFSDDRVLTFYGDAAWLEELELENLRGSPPSRTLGSIGFGFLYGIRPLKGLPVIFRYA